MAPPWLATPYSGIRKDCNIWAGPCLVHINFGKCKGGLECIDRVL